MNKHLAILLLFELIFSGCSGPSETASAPMLPGSFCDTLQFYEVRMDCFEANEFIEDDPRIREYYAHSDEMLQNEEDLDDCADGIVAARNMWGNATTIQEKDAAYRSYYSSAQACALEIEATDNQLAEFQTFLGANEAYFEAQGLDTPNAINDLAGIREDYRMVTLGIYLEFGTMESEVELTEPEQQEANELLNTLVEIVIETEE